MSKKNVQMYLKYFYTDTDLKLTIVESCIKFSKMLTSEYFLPTLL